MLKDKMISDMLVHGYSKKTIRCYTNCVKKLTRFYLKPPDTLEAKDIYTFFLHLRKKELSDSTVLVYYSAISLFYSLLNKDSVMSLIPTPKKKQKLAVIFNKEEIISFLSFCDTLKEKAIFTLLYSSGIRIGELAKLRIQDIDFERNSIFISQGKGNRERYAMISSQAAIFLKQYMQFYRPTSFLFFSSKCKTYSINIRWIQIAFKRICREAGVEKNAKVHTLRHSFATHLLDEGYSIFYIQKLLGHTALNSTLGYLHVNPNYLLNIASPMEKINFPKIGIFETTSQYGLELQTS